MSEGLAQNAGRSRPNGLRGRICQQASIPGTQALIPYEYPFNECVRTLLCLEDLFERLDFFLVQEYPLRHRMALTTLLEAVDVVGRIDPKPNLLKELNRQRQTFIALRADPQIDQDAPDAVISELETVLGNLTATHNRAGQLIADDEWLTNIRSRATIPGGICEFDLSAYPAWQHHPTERCRTGIVKWAQPLISLHDAAMIVLRLLRESDQSDKVTANVGSCQQMLSDHVYQLMQVRLDESALGFIPEISTNKYMLWVCFTQQDGDLRPRLIDANIPSRLKLCNF